MTVARVAPSTHVLRRILAANEPLLWLVGALVVLTGTWELATRIDLVDPLFSSSPTRIVATFFRLLFEPDFWTDMQVSGVEFLVGFALAIATGVPIGILAGWYRRVFYLLDPHLTALYATPRVALLPLVLLWFGLGLWSKVAIVYLGAFFPIAINVLHGVRTTDARFVRVARSFGVGDLRLFKTVVLPSAVPFVLTGVRLGIGRALIGVVVAEFYVSTAGIGHRIFLAGTTFQTDVVFVGVAVVTVAGVVCMQLVQAVEKRFDRWRPPLVV